MNTTNEVACAVCGAEHDSDTAPELDSTHLCADCVTTQLALSRPSRHTVNPLMEK